MFEDNTTSFNSVEVINDYNFNSFQYKRYIRNSSGILGKRNLNDAFGEGSHDEDRYGRVIDDDFFENNIGHNVIRPSVIRPSVKLNQSYTIYWRYKLGLWREKYNK